jgi:peptidoglycan/LPS O-acetylase OafA/YrhL
MVQGSDMSRRSRTSVAYLCIVVVALAAFLPGVAAIDYAVPELPWILLPDLAAAALVLIVPVCDEQPFSLLSVISSRAPPPALS